MMRSLDSALRIAAIGFGAFLIGTSLHAFANHPIAPWTMFSISVFLALLAASGYFLIRRQAELFAMTGALFSTLVVGRLVSTMRFEDAGGAALSSLDPLLVAETGPGLTGPTYASLGLFVLLCLMLLRHAWKQTHAVGAVAAAPTVNDWALTFLRLYVGLMFIAHFAGHLFAGPIPFGVFESYFGSIGLPYPAAFVILAGVIELAVAIGLAFGLMTRIAAAGAAIYLFVSVGLGGHYSVGYVWVLPTGGWEFPALWIFAVALFTLTGGGVNSIDRWLTSSFPKLPKALRLSMS
jgi:putative oxidoreductase